MYDIWKCGSKVNFTKPSISVRSALKVNQPVNFTVDYSSLGKQEYERFKKFTDTRVDPFAIIPLHIYN